jgi:hypothetical protein
MQEDTTEMKQLAREVIKAYKANLPPQAEFVKCLSGAADVNESVFQNSEDAFTFRFRFRCSAVGNISIQAASVKPQFSILHLQVLIWALLIRSGQCDGSILVPLELQILSVVSSGGDCNLPIAGVKILWQDSLLFCISQSTLKEFILDMMKTSPKLFLTTDRTFHPATRKILEIIDNAKATNGMSSKKLDFSKSAVSHWQNFLFSEELSDVTFVCLDGTTHPAHQLVLSGESPYFKAYFTGPWSEQNEDRQWKTQIKSSTLKTVLTYMYTGSFGKSLVDKSLDTVCEILQVGQEFQMSSLVEVCCNMILPNLAIDNIKKMTCVAATVTLPFMGPTNIWKHCVKFVRKNSTVVLMDPNFMALATEHPDLWNKLRDEISPSRKRSRS